MSGHTYTHTHSDTHTHTYTHDNYYNPRCAHAHRGLIRKQLSGWNLWVWLVGVVSRRWVWLVGGINGCG